MNEILHAARLLALLITLFQRGPVASRLRDLDTHGHSTLAPRVAVSGGAIYRIPAVPMLEVMGDMVEAADMHRVPVSILAATCFVESGFSERAVFCGAGGEGWSCSHGARCEETPEEVLQRATLRGRIRRQLRVAAFILQRHHEADTSWAYAAQSYHLGNIRRRLEPCPSAHRHHHHGGVYGLAVLDYAQRIERAAGINTLGEPWELLQARSSGRVVCAR